MKLLLESSLKKLLLNTSNTGGSKIFGGVRSRYSPIGSECLVKAGSAPSLQACRLAAVESKATSSTSNQCNQPRGYAVPCLS